MSHPSSFQPGDPKDLGGVYANASGAPISDPSAYQRMGPHGPVLLQDTRKSTWTK